MTLVKSTHAWELGERGEVKVTGLPNLHKYATPAPTEKSEVVACFGRFLRWESHYFPSSRTHDGGLYTLHPSTYPLDRTLLYR